MTRATIQLAPSSARFVLSPASSPGPCPGLQPDGGFSGVFRHLCEACRQTRRHADEFRRLAAFACDPTQSLQTARSLEAFFENEHRYPITPPAGPLVRCLIEKQIGSDSSIELEAERLGEAARVQVGRCDQRHHPFALIYYSAAGPSRLRLAVAHSDSQIG